MIVFTLLYQERKTSDDKNSSGYLDFFDSDSDSDAMDDTLGDTDAQLDTDMEDANVTIPSGNPQNTAVFKN